MHEMRHDISEKRSGEETCDVVVPVHFGGFLLLLRTSAPRTGHKEDDKKREQDDRECNNDCDNQIDSLHGIPSFFRMVMGLIRRRLLDVIDDEHINRTRLPVQFDA